MQIITTDSKNNAVLYQPTLEVEVPLSESIKQKIEEMRIFYKSFKDKSGFAAPQVGLSEKIILIEKDLFDTAASATDGEPVILINPSWKPINDEKELDIEGCLSVPGKMGVVSRHLNVELTALQYCAITGEISQIKREYRREFSCALWQHEIDHLDGKIYVDKAKIILNEDDYLIIRQYLVEVGMIQQGMTIFDLGPMIYHLASEWQQAHPKDIRAFLSDKINKQQCPCGSEKTFTTCCDLYISGKHVANTPEALMRSRYSAYTKANIPYIQKTMRGPASQDYNPDEAFAWAKQSEWLGLKVIKSHQQNSNKGYVEFIAQFKINQQTQQIHEYSEFECIDGIWYYIDGKRISN